MRTYYIALLLSLLAGPVHAGQIGTTQNVSGFEGIYYFFSGGGYYPAPYNNPPDGSPYTEAWIPANASGATTNGEIVYTGNEIAGRVAATMTSNSYEFGSSITTNGTKGGNVWLSIRDKFYVDAGSDSVLNFNFDLSFGQNYGNGLAELLLYNWGYSAYYADVRPSSILDYWETYNPQAYSLGTQPISLKTLSITDKTYVYLDFLFYLSVPSGSPSQVNALHTAVLDSLTITDTQGNLLEGATVTSALAPENRLVSFTQPGASPVPEPATLLLLALGLVGLVGMRGRRWTSGVPNLN